jgi:hypothetical protein
MTYLPQVKIPRWMEILRHMFTWIFTCSSYLILVLIIVSVLQLLKITPFYFIILGLLLVLSLAGIVNIQSRIEPNVGW